MVVSRKSKRMREQEISREKNDANLTRMTTVEACTFPSGFFKYLKGRDKQKPENQIRCCKDSCIKRFSVHYIMLVRFHFVRLPKGDRFRFVRGCAQKENDMERYVYVFPDEEAFKPMLAAAYPDCVEGCDADIPPQGIIHSSICIDNVDKNRVCKRGFLWMLLESSDRLLYVPSHHKRARGIQMRFHEGK